MNTWTAADIGDLEQLRGRTDLYSAHQGVLPLYVAIARGHNECAAEMLRHMSVDDVITADGNKPLDAAERLGNDACADMVVGQMTMEQLRAAERTPRVVREARRRIRVGRMMEQFQQYINSDTITVIQQYIQ